MAPIHLPAAVPLHPALPAVSDALPGTPDAVRDESRAAVEEHLSRAPPAFVTASADHPSDPPWTSPCAATPGQVGPDQSCRNR